MMDIDFKCYHILVIFFAIFRPLKIVDGLSGCKSASESEGEYSSSEGSDSPVCGQDTTHSPLSSMLVTLAGVTEIEYSADGTVQSNSLHRGKHIMVGRRTADYNANTTDVHNDLVQCKWTDVVDMLLVLVAHAVKLTSTNIFLIFSFL